MFKVKYLKKKSKKKTTYYGLSKTAQVYFKSAWLITKHPLTYLDYLTYLDVK